MAIDSGAALSYLTNTGTGVAGNLRRLCIKRKEQAVKRLIILGLFVAAFVAIAKAIQQQCAAWAGLTESEVRTKFETKVGGRMPAEKTTAVADMVVAAMRDRGFLEEEGDEAEVSLDDVEIDLTEKDPVGV